MIFFTADTHFGHSNIIKYCNRPFQNTEQHDNELIDRWNNIISSNDVVYHLGDFGFGDSKYLRNICNRLNGQINLIKGNHDKRITHISSRFGFVKDTYLLETKLFKQNVKIFLSHYPHRTWIHRSRNCYHLYGHVHGNMEPYGLSFDVGVDTWNYTPISIEQVDEYIKTNLMATWEQEKNKLNVKNIEMGKI